MGNLITSILCKACYFATYAMSQILKAKLQICGASFFFAHIFLSNKTATTLFYKDFFTKISIQYMLSVKIQSYIYVLAYCNKITLILILCKHFSFIFFYKLHTNHFQNCYLRWYENQRRIYFYKHLKSHHEICLRVL